MTHKIENAVLICEAAPDFCELCGAFDELRPYGPNNERICFDCGMKNKATTAKKFGELFDGPKS